MNTDKKTKCLSVFIRVYPWPNWFFFGELQALAGGGAERNFRQLRSLKPAQGAIQPAFRRPSFLHRKGVMVMRDGVPEGAERAAYPSGGEIRGGGGGPKTGHPTRLRLALPQQEAAAAAHHQQNFLERHGLHLAQLHRKPGGCPF